MAVWWLTEAIPLPATSLIPLVAFPVLGVLPIGSAAGPYADPVIFLFLGGFILGLSMERWGLHKRIALITILIVGTGPKRVIGGFMLASACISMWVNNTSTTIMMLPIAVSVIALVAQRHAPPGTPLGQAPSPDPNFDSTLLLGIAYASSIGGVGTLIGTAPNAIMRAFVERELGRTIGFAEWLMLGLPLVVVFLVMTWVYMTSISQPVRLKTIPGGRALIRGELKALGRMSRGEWTVLAVFSCTVALWVLRPWITALGTTHDLVILRGLNDTTIAIAAALALFLIPVSAQERRFAMDWTTAEKLPWGALLLFGGGLSLAAAVSATGVDEFIGTGFAGLAGMPLWVVILVVAAVVVFLTELCSNTALTTVMLPVLAAAAVSMEIDALRLVIPATLAASMAFMMPVGTPPNAIVFATGKVTMGQMARTGLGLNILSILSITVFCMIVGDGVLAG
jgi:sodium-dependent dicarboxylate transporter 2/3/5